MKKICLIAGITLAGLLVLCLTKASFARRNPSGRSRRVIIGFKDGTGPQAAERRRHYVRERGGRVRRSYRHLPAAAAELSESQISRFRADPRVAYIEEDGEVHALDTETELDNSWGVKHIGAGDVHPYNNKGAGINVAIIDTGINYGHPDLGNNYKGGYDFVNDDDNPMDDNGHGTHCAGIVAAEENGQGVIGVAPEASLYAVKVLDSGGSGYLSDVVAGIEWAINHSMDIISMSLGTDYNYQTLRHACDNAYAAGILLVAAAGNDYSTRRGRERDTVDYPARYDSVIAVGATNDADVKASWSSTGSALELAAPGVNIYSTYLGNGYTTKSGTSMACPHVAGVAALILVAGSDVGVRTTLQDTADDLGDSGWDNWYGYGLVDAGEAAGALENQAPVADAGPDQSVRTESEVQLDGSGSSDPDGDTLTYSWTFTSTPSSSSATLSGDKTVNPTFVADKDGIYKVQLEVNDGELTDSDTVSVTAQANQTPVADAGPDQTVSDADGTSSESVTLDGSGSYDPDGTIDSYEWKEGAAVLGTAAVITKDFSVSGSPHTVTLTVTDDEGATASDDAVITVNANQSPVADAGPDQTATVGQTVNFDGSGSSDPDGSIVSYDWDFGDDSTGTGVSVTHVYLTAGKYTVTLTVEDNGGKTVPDTATVTVSEEPAEKEVFYDSFESSADWTANWSQDSQNDWRRRTARKKEGNYAAEVDGRATDAQLISRNINMQGKTNAAITFWWYIESGLDTGEYLAFDVSTDGGPWVQKATLSGNVDTENQWHNVSITDVTAINNLRIRFRGKMSSSQEDAYVDVVKVIAW